MTAKTYRITDGTRSTYELKAKIKKAGGRFDATTKSWLVDLYSSDSLHNYNGQLTFTPVDQANDSASLAQKAKQYDDLYNEGGEGFNPYR